MGELLRSAHGNPEPELENADLSVASPNRDRPLAQPDHSLDFSLPSPRNPKLDRDRPVPSRLQRARNWIRPSVEWHSQTFCQSVLLDSRYIQRNCKHLSELPNL